MPTQYPCKFIIPAAQANSKGARLTGGFQNLNGPLSLGDSIQIQVQTTGQGGPSTLNGYMIFSPALAAGSAQVTPSPFINATNNNFLCFASQTGVAGTSGPGNNTTFTFNALTYNGGFQGSYELTFVAEDASTKMQWSEDPEFDTEG